MKCVLSILLGVFLAGTAAANPIRNSSFELDSANFGVVRFARSGGGYLKPEFDSASAVHGRQRGDEGSCRRRLHAVLR